MRVCMVNGCTSREGTPEFKSKKYTLHQFPNTHEKIQSWLLASGDHFPNIDTAVRYVLQHRNKFNIRLCSLHFESDMFISSSRARWTLKSDAIPTKFPRPSVLALVNELSCIDSEMSEPSLQEDTSMQSCINDEQSSIAYDHDYVSRFSYSLQESDKCSSSTNTIEMQNSHKTTSTPHYPSVCLSQVPGTLSHLAATKESLQAGKKVSGKPQKKGKLSQSKSKEQCLPESVPYIEKVMDISLSPVMQRAPISELPFTPISRISTVLRDPDTDSTLYDAEFDDPDFLPDNEYKGDSPFLTDPTPDDYVAERKILVFESCLDQLLHTVQKCTFSSTCSAPIMEIEKVIFGTLLTVYTICEKQHRCLFWKSQPMIANKAYGNILASASILFSGSNYAKVSELFAIFGIPFISKSLHNLYKKKYLFPIVDLHYKKERKNIVDSLKGQILSLSGDRQFDCPGFGAKYCTYSIMEETTQKIIECYTVQDSETTSSVAIESKAFTKCMDQLLAEELQIGILVTNRHASIQKLMVENYKQIKHQFDIWHYCKSLRNKLEKVTKDRSCKELVPWTNSILNHFCASCYFCQGNPDSLKEKWTSVLHHITNEHEWESEDGIDRCNHREISESELKDRTRIWIPKNGVAHLKLANFVNDSRLQKDFKHLTEFCNRGSLEGYRSMVLKYCPKRIHFTMDGMVARTKLAAMAHNSNIDRQTTIETIHENSVQAASFDHIFPMVADVIRLATGDIDVYWESQRFRLPRNIALPTNKGTD
ncbi:uncharacterized protein LOC134577858 [Pelobates fuscus]|uniref:uncharacterized protein LOC134577858 n=1 Tax=Pelobates fuscus TaxID=191477 RepID=UPI002FE44252